MATANDCLAINRLLLLDTAAATYPSTISCNELAIANCCSNVATVMAPAKKEKPNDSNGYKTLLLQWILQRKEKKKATVIAIDKQMIVMATDTAPGNPCLVINQLLLLDAAAATYPLTISCNEWAVANCCSNVATATAPAKKEKPKESNGYKTLLLPRILQ